MSVSQVTTALGRIILVVRLFVRYRFRSIPWPLSARCQKVAPSLSVVTTSVSRCCQMSPGGPGNHPLVFSVPWTLVHSTLGVDHRCGGWLEGGWPLVRISSSRYETSGLVCLFSVAKHDEKCSLGCLFETLQVSYSR